MDKYLVQLNDSQRDAVLCIKGPVMIIAGAGSGKTRVLVHRIVHMLHHGIDPFNILSLTFTNKAAREMKKRISLEAGDESRNLWMGTFHSVFAKLLRVEAPRLGYPSSFTIYDTDDAKNLIKDIVKDQGLDDKIYKPGLVYNRISSAKNNLYSWKEYQDNPELVNDDKTAGKPHLGLLYEIYQKRNFKSGAMDFDDLLFNTYILLRDFPDILHKYQNKFKYVLVDEFQDTNYAQYIIVKKLAAQHENICVVGDDAQSIYAFRGANIQNILSFKDDYPDLKTFKLEQNYRSTKNIVNAANSVISNNKHQLKKSVWTDNADGELIRIIKGLSDNEEGNMVANSIFEEKLQNQLHYKDIAILYRTNAQSRSMEEALRRKGIPYRIYGGVSFYARKEIKDLLSYFRLTVNPNDEEALKRVINYPKREIGKTTLDKIIVAADQENLSLWNVLEKINSIETGINAPTRARISDFVIMIKSFTAQLKTKTAFDLASHIAMSTGLLKELYADKSPEGISHYENLQELLNGIKEFTDKGTTALPAPSAELEADVTLRTLDVFLQDIALVTDGETDEKNEDTVSLMTIHSSKGLEFKYVYLVGMEENLFPSQMALQSRVELEEERRLFYVAITRAEIRLTLSYALSRYKWGNLISCEPSRFITEINPDYLDDQTAVTIRPNSFEKPRNWSDFGKHNSKPEVVVATPGPNFKKIPKPRFAAVSEGAPFEAADPNQTEVGMDVEHQKFGTGKVVTIEGNFPELKATVTFPGIGNKHLLLKYAKLRIIK
ncbi:MAG: UvrD-helicase domain-containing protein [Bacteroidetes bacterium]|nr:UvrD-helicase domain-containing protein [Bacteroidota bacterium]